MGKYHPGIKHGWEVPYTTAEIGSHVSLPEGKRVVI